jgi:hypothetical protein
MDKLRNLNQKVGLSGFVWRELIKDSLSSTLKDRLSLSDLPEEDDPFIELVKQVGERWETHCREQGRDPADGDRPCRGDSKKSKHKKKGRGDSPDSGRQKESNQSRDNKGDTGKQSSSKKSQSDKSRFSSKEEALKGIAPSLIEKRIKENRCLRCNMDNHRWSKCRREIVTLSSRKVAGQKRIADTAQKDDSDADEKSPEPAGKKTKVAGRRRAWESQTQAGESSKNKNESAAFRGRIYEVDSEEEID